MLEANESTKENSWQNKNRIRSQQTRESCVIQAITLDLILSFFPSLSLPDVLCNPVDLIRRKETPFEAMTGRTVPSSDGPLAEVFWGFPQL